MNSCCQSNWLSYLRAEWNSKCQLILSKWFSSILIRVMAEDCCLSVTLCTAHSSPLTSRDKIESRQSKTEVLSDRYSMWSSHSVFNFQRAMLHESLLSLSLPLLLLLVALSHAEVVSYQNCVDSVDVCNIDEVRVDPCPQAAERAACHIRRRRPSKMSFDFTPKFDADSLEASLVWVKKWNRVVAASLHGAGCLQGDQLSG